MPALPPDASRESRIRHDLARRLTEGCPRELGEGIALTGSVARGVADRFSDIELAFWVRDLPPVEECQAWLRAAGARTEPPEDDEVSPGSFGTKSWFGGVFVETIWQTWAALDRALDEVVAARMVDHWALTWAWHVAHAVPLRAHPALDAWQSGLAHYPDALEDHLIRAATLAWADPHWYPVSAVNLWPLVYRDARIALAGRLMRETEKALRIVFAVNRRWEPDWKWLASESRRLERAPERLVARVGEIVTLADPARSAAECLTLILDALDLAPERHGLDRQRRLVREALRPEALLAQPDDNG